MVIVAIHGRAICSFMHYKYGRAIHVQKLLTVFIVMRGRAVCNVAQPKVAKLWPRHSFDNITYYCGFALNYLV